jgi:hypothetical protein
VFKSRCLFLCIIGVSWICRSSFAEENSLLAPKPSSRSKDPRPEHLNASHTEGKGLGYSKGYSSLDLFLSQPFHNRTAVPFLDLRGHIFNDGKYAANAGLGFRYLSHRYKQVWGINAVYDYLQGARRDYNQVGGGLEALGENWDARMNFYIPVGGKRKNIYRFEYKNFGSMTIEGDPFLGLDALTISGFGLKAREQFALKGIDSLFGYRFCKKKFGELHVGAGPYYYWGSSSKTKNVFSSTTKHAFGGRLAMRVSFLDYLILEGVGSYDVIFKWCGQGTVTLNLPFDFTFKLKKSTKSSYCLQKRLYEPVWRNEIVAVDSLNRFTNDPRVLDPDFNP